MINLPKGTRDVLPGESYKWHYIEGKVRALAASFGYSEVRTPTFEATELFLRGVGETTDIVNKEMYTFEDKGGRSMTLKPEGTAGAARMVIENSLYNEQMPLKMYYITPVFRYERPQSGRLREHHQFGVEQYGADSGIADAEVILIAKNLFDSLGIGNLELNINSIGCKECRPKYNEALKEYLRANLDKMCGTCRERFDKNPLRILDCKEEGCKVINAGAPMIQDFLCPDCVAHQDELKAALKSLGIAFTVNPRIVRGLDYYTKTVFEFVSGNIGAQGTVCGGGRYNNLAEEVGGKACPAVGFGMGIERLIMVMEQLGLPIGKPERPMIYVAPLGDTSLKCFAIAAELRSKYGLSAETDLMKRGLKAQLKYANKINARYLAVIGGDEIANGIVKIKDMDAGAETPVGIEELGKYLSGIKG